MIIFKASILMSMLLIVVTSTFAIAQPAAKEIETLQVITFEGGWNLPIWAAKRQGFFKQQGIDVALTYTVNSVELIQGLLNNRYDIGIAGIDNLVAYQEGQGEVVLTQEPDLFAFMGYDSGLLSLMAGPKIKTIMDLKGKTLSVDALNTGFAFVLRELIVRGGLKESEVTFVSVGGTSQRYDALLANKQDGTLLKAPFNLLAKSHGFNEIATADTLGSYQGTTGLARRSWAAKNEEILIKYIRAYRAGIDWLYDPKNRAVAEALLIANIPDMTQSLATQSYDLLFAEKGGLSRDGALDIQGIKTVLMLREKYATPSKKLNNPEKYIDLHYYKKATL